MSINSVKNDTVSQDSIVNAQKPIPPTITGYSVSGKDDTALDPAGGQTILLNGTGFQRGATITIDGSAISVVTWVSSNQLSFTSTAKAAGTYAIYVVNADLGTAIYIPGLIYSTLPTWTTPSGSLGSFYETNSISSSVVATGDAPITYSLFSGSLPSGATLSSSGTITGTAPVDSGSTTYTFTIQATDAQLQDSTRSFSLTINTDVVTWSSPANASVITSYEYANISNVSLSANSAAGKSVSFSANALPTGLTLSGNVISGAATTVANTAVLLTATAATTNRTATETVFFNVQQDVVTWSNPSSNTSISLDGTAYSNTLSASSAAGFNVSYTANSLPTGLTLSSATISGTPTVEGTSTTLLTATAATTNRSSQRTITWTVSLSDVYWKFNTLLLSANSSIETQSFVADNSLNNAQLTVFGDTRAQNLNPYQVGYYSASFNGTTDYVLFPSDITVSGAFTIEFWMNSPNANAASTNYYIYTQSATATNRCFLAVLNNTTYNYFRVATNFGSSSFSTFNFPSLFPNNTWFHIAIVRDSSNNLTAFVNGVRSSTGTVSNSDSGIMNVIGRVAPSGYYNGYISNFRIVVGSAVYDPTQSTITVPTSPLTAIANTQALVLQSNRFNDNSVNNYALTLTGTPSISTAHPFTTQYQVTPYYSSYFNGSTDYIQTTINPSTFSSSWTIECWVYQGAQKNEPAVILGTASYGLLLYFTSSLYMSCEISSDGSTAAVNAYGSITNNKWYHIAIVKNGSGSNNVTAYVNGVSAGQGTLSNPIVNAGNLRIGYGYSTWYWNGYISNLRIVNGTAVYTTNFTPSTTPLTAIANTALLTCQSSTIIDNSGNSSSLTVNGNTRQDAISPFIPSYSSTQITTYGSGYFDGTGDYLKLNSTLDLSTSNFTAEAWIYITSLSAQRDVIASCANTIVDNTTVDWTIRINTNGTVQFTTCSGATNTNVISTAVILINTWNHVAVVRNGTTGTVYVNGVGVSGTISGTLNTNANLYIGIMATTNITVGYISDVRIVKSVLYTSNFVPQFTSSLSNVANTQLLTLQTNGSHNNSVFKDNSGFNNLITRNGNTTNGTFSPYGDNWSYYIGGTTSDYIDFSGLPTIGTGNFTVECWVFMPDSSQYDGYTGFVTTATIGSASVGFTMCRDYFWVGNGSSNPVISPTANMVYGQWMHLALTRSGTTVRGFVNGTLLGTTQSSSADINSTQGRFGSRYFDSMQYGPLRGYISNVRIIKGTALYTTSFTVPNPPLVAVSGTLLLTANNNRISDISVTNATMTKTGNVTVQKFSPFSTITVPKYYSSYCSTTSNYWSLTPVGTAFPSGGNSWTVEGWFSFTSFSAQVGLATVGDLFQWYIPSGGTTIKVEFRNSSGGGSWGTQTATYTFSTNTWYHLAIVNNNGSIQQYINGTATGAAISVGSAASGGTGAAAFWIGVSDGYPFASPDNPLNGCVSNFRTCSIAVYTGNFTVPTTQLTTTQSAGTNISAITSGQCKLLLFTTNTSIDVSSNCTVAVVGAPVITPIAPFTPTVSTTPVSYSPTTFGGSIYFDGTGDYLTIPSTSVSSTLQAGAFTWESWIYPIAPTAANTSAILYGTWNNGTNQWAFEYSHSGLFSLSARIFLYVGNYGTNETAKYSTTQLPLYTWSHIAWVRTSANVISLYVNGVSQTLNAYSSGLAWSDSYSNTTGQTCGIGGTSNYTAYQGYISDLRYTQGAALYTSNFYPGPSPLTSTQTIGTTTYNSTLLLNGTSGGVIDATRTVDLESFGDAKVTPFSPYNGSYYSTLFASGTSDYLSIAQKLTLSTATTPFTMEAWVYFNAFTSTAIASSQWAGGGITFIMGMGNGSAQTTGSTPWFGYYSGSAWTIPVQSATSLSIGTWYHLAYVYTGSAATIYANGTSVGTASASTWVTAGSISTTGFYIGTSWAGANYLSGYVSNFRLVIGTALYTNTFTPPTSPLTAVANTVYLTCQSNKFVDNSTNNYAITTSGSPKIATQNPFQVNTGISYYFDGTGDYLTIANINNLTFAFAAGNFTIECWVYQPDINAGTRIIAALTPFGAGNTGWALYFGAGYISWFYNNANRIVSSTAVVAGTWNHLAIVRNSGTTTMYLNGVATGSTYADTNNYSGTGQYVGSDTTQNYYGYIADLRITKGYARYTGAFTPPTLPLRTN